MAALTRDQIVNAADREVISFYVEEWGGVVYLRPLSTTERNSVEALVLEEDKKKRAENLKFLRCKTIAFGLVDENGQRYFNPHNRDDLRLIDGKNAAVNERLFEKIQEISGMRKVDEEEALGNFDDQQEGDSYTD